VISITDNTKGALYFLRKNSKSAPHQRYIFVSLEDSHEAMKTRHDACMQVFNYCYVTQEMHANLFYCMKYF